MTWDFHIMRFGGLLAWELPEACNFSSLYSLAHSILSGSGLRVRWILKFVFSLVNWIFIHVTYICLSSASLYLSQHVVEHCFMCLLCRQNEAVSVSFLFYNLSHGLCSQTGWGASCKVRKEGHVCHFSVLNISNFQTWTSIEACRGLFEVGFGIHFLSAQLFSVTFKNSFEEHSPMGVISSVPRMASDIFLHPPCSADRLFGVKNTQSLCITFSNFFASLLYAFPDLMTALSKPGRTDTMTTRCGNPAPGLPENITRNDSVSIKRSHAWRVLLLFFTLVTEGYS